MDAPNGNPYVLALGNYDGQTTGKAGAIVCLLTVLSQTDPEIAAYPTCKNPFEWICERFDALDISDYEIVQRAEATFRRA
jgi:hypothetical protein